MSEKCVTLKIYSINLKESFDVNIKMYFTSLLSILYPFSIGPGRILNYKI